MTGEFRPTRVQIRGLQISPFTPKSDQFQVSPAASQDHITEQYGELGYHSLCRGKLNVLPILTLFGMYFLNLEVKALERLRKIRAQNQTTPTLGLGQTSHKCRI